MRILSKEFKNWRNLIIIYLKQSQILSFHVNLTIKMLLLSFWFSTHKSIHQRCSIKKGALENFAKFTRKHLCQGLFFNKVLIWHKCFPVNFAKSPRTTFLQNTSGRLLLCAANSNLECSSICKKRQSSLLREEIRQKKSAVQNL